jgi:hypothetical protein
MGAKIKRAKLIWRDLGPIKANTALDNVPKQSGVYKLTFHLWGNAYAYIGEAGARGLRARIRDYANSPTQGNKIEHLLYDLLKEAGEAGSVQSFSHIWFGLGGARHWLKR